MKTTLRIILLAAAAINWTGLRAADAGRVLDMLDLTRPGLEEVARLHHGGNDSAAASALLDYYKNRTGVKSVGVNAEKPRLTKEERRWADDGLRHVFFVHKGYQPSYFYGDDINWQYWPVKDNELRWQLHRTKWWVPMGKAYRVTGDEKYAEEWVLQYRDWIKKNPSREMSMNDFEMVTPTMADSIAENARFAWRPLEVADRLEHQIEQFELFLPSPAFTPDFLIEFLDNYHRHGQYLDSHYSAQGNHLLFEAQRIVFAGAFFPEFKDAPAWRRHGVDILNREMAKQVLPDGTQFELDPGYHMAAINIFAKALEMMDANGYRGEFPGEYLDTIEKMIVFTYNIAFPDLSLPMFSDNKLHTRKGVMPNYRKWRRLFPRDKYLTFIASDGKKGNVPDYTSRAFTRGGFYVLRSGWDSTATVMVLKAGPKGEWHNQYDNGTFELWIDGRNFFPDSGSFIYGGDSTVQKQRDWFRQTKVHNTLTLDDRTLTNRVSELLKWQTAPDTDVAVVETPGYDGLTHRRAVFFVDHKFYVIADEAYGPATGDVALHYNLVECDPLENAARKSVRTSFADGNDITLKVFGADRMTREEGWVSRAYREKKERPAYAFRYAKNNSKPARFITVIYPDGNAAIEARYKGGFSAGGAALQVTVDGKKYDLSYTL